MFLLQPKSLLDIVFVNRMTSLHINLANTNKYLSSSYGSERVQTKKPILEAIQCRALAQTYN